MGKIYFGQYRGIYSWKVTWLPFGYDNPKQLEDMERYAYRRFYLRPSYILKRILKLRKFEDFKRIFKGATGLLKVVYSQKVKILITIFTCKLD